MNIVYGKDIEKGLTASNRVYLCGYLHSENGVRHIPTDGYEIGVSNYQGFKADMPHYHSFNTEYNYVIEGEVKLLLLNGKTEYKFGKGDLYVINSNEPYVSKYLPGTRIIFSKVPGGNDKVLLTPNAETNAWMSMWNDDFRDI